MSTFVLPLRDIGDTTKKLAGNKAANLAELSRLPEVRVPDGFCVTTDAFREVTFHNRTFNLLLDELRHLSVRDRQKIDEAGARMRSAIQNIFIPNALASEVGSNLARFGADDAYAVRSSATAEDLPAASFAGQQDTWLNIVGKDAVLHHIRECWASLFTGRAIVYRMQNGFDHQEVLPAVVIQRMIPAEAAGVAFTADPLTGNRKVVRVDAAYGTGEAVMSGRVNADNYEVRSGVITAKTVAALHGQVLSDVRILQLESCCRRIEQHFGVPQDIEWCLWNGEIYILQSRPITMLYPIPESEEPGNRVYVSVGHQQMMTDALKPLGLSVWQLIAFRPMHQAGGRLFVDITQSLASPTGREMMMKAMGRHDPLIREALATIVDRGDFIRPLPADPSPQPSVQPQPPPSPQPPVQAQPPGQTGNAPPPWAFPSKIQDGRTKVAGLIARSQSAIEALRGSILSKSGTTLFDFILEDIGQLRKSMADSESMAVISTAIDASDWLNEKMKDWLGESNVADAISQSAAGNITAGMGLALLDVADAIRPFPEVVAFLERSSTGAFLSTAGAFFPSTGAVLPSAGPFLPSAGAFFEALRHLPGGEIAEGSISGFLDKYGMRCPGEIDITAARWSERPAALCPLILSNIRAFQPGAAKRKFEEGLRLATAAELSLLDRLRSLPDGERKAAETKKVIGLIRDLIGYREYPKYQIINHLYLYRLALLQEAGRLLRCGVIRDIRDVGFMTFEEFRETVRSGHADHQLIAARRSAQSVFERLSPPRVITSDGEIVLGKYRRNNLPDGALPGLAVSSGIAEGRARVVLNMEDTAIADGDILVTRFTDPGWTPLFVSVKGLITEVGGLMTHGAVIAREYGLPAVVGVEDATRKIKDGQRVRVNGTAGYVEILDAGLSNMPNPDPL